ncbi:MAG: hypothetical protein HYT80_10825 [Euryarchaeota archaeon]|nr:hypothetical protein [Euryarchaeota archaeon]
MRVGYVMFVAVSLLAFGVLPWAGPARAECDRSGGVGCFLGTPQVNATVECSDNVETQEFDATVNCTVDAWTGSAPDALLVGAQAASGQTLTAKAGANGKVNATFKRGQSQPPQLGVNYTIKFHPHVPGIAWNTTKLNFTGYIAPGDNQPQSVEVAFKVDAQPGVPDVDIEYVTWDGTHDFRRSGVGFAVAKESRTPSLAAWFVFLVAAIVVLLSAWIDRRP